VKGTSRQGAKRRWRIPILTRAAMVRLAILLLVLLALGIWCDRVMIKMPGKSYQGEPIPLSETEIALRDKLKSDIDFLAVQLGERNVIQYHALEKSAEFIETSLRDAGYDVKRQGFTARGKLCENIEVEIQGADHPNQIVIIGAHYDTVFGCPGANDNGSGVAALLALARRFQDKTLDRTLRFVAFVNEEPPFFQTEKMGSLVYARRCRERNENIVAMISLETMGYYSDDENSQNYPKPFNLFYPSRGNFIAFVGNLSSKQLVRDSISVFRERCKFPSEGIAIWGQVTGIGWSDHWSFWQEGYPAIMVTDTALFRYRYYHTPDDTPDKINFDRFAQVITGMEQVIGELAKVKPR